MIDDAELLRRYCEEKSESAFAELVQRRIGLVYSMALRHTAGDVHRARDIAQIVFTDLARKAPSLCRRPVLAGWLCRSAQLAGRQAARAEQRRLFRETDSLAMNEPSDANDLTWAKARPFIDDALGELDERDRDAIALRFFEQRPFGEIGEKLALGENGARMRVDRALDKLRVLLGRRGVTSTTAALGLALATHMGAATPPGLAAAISSAAVAGAATVAGVSGGGAILTLMGTIKGQIGITAALAALGGTAVVIQSNANHDAREELARLQQRQSDISDLKDENRKLAEQAAQWAQAQGDVTKLDRLREEIARVQEAQEKAARAESAARALQVTAASTSGESAEPAYSLSQVDRQPKVRFQSAPVYPAELRKGGASGDVMVAFVVDAFGNVVNARAVKSSNGAFEQSAVDAVKRWKFTAGEKAGIPVNVEMRIPIIFSISKDAGLGQKNWF